MDDARAGGDFILVSKIVTTRQSWSGDLLSDPNYKIIIQQDDAGGHCTLSDPFLLNTIIRVYEDGGLELPGTTSWDTQPLNSPDLKICDLGLFDDAIQ